MNDMSIDNLAIDLPPLDVAREAKFKIGDEVVFVESMIKPMAFGGYEI